MKKIVLALMCLMLMGLSAQAKKNNPFVGDWTMTQYSMMGEMVFYLHIEADAKGNLSGVITNDGGVPASPSPMYEVKVKGNVLTYKMMPNSPEPITLTLNAEGNVMEGTTSNPFMGDMPVKAVRK